MKRKHNNPILEAGDACRFCNAPVVKRTAKQKNIDRAMANGTYYHAWYFFCPKCRKVYNPEEARIYCDGSLDRMDDLRAVRSIAQAI